MKIVRWIVIRWFVIVVMDVICEKAGLAGSDKVAEDVERIKVLVSGFCFFGMNYYLVLVQDARPI